MNAKSNAMNLPTATNNWGLTPKAKGVLPVASQGAKGSDPNWLGAGGKFRSLAQAMLVVALGVGASLVRAEVDYTGSWFTCEAKKIQDHRFVWNVLTIQKNQAGHLTWITEDRSHYVSSGFAYPKEYGLAMHGCRSYEGSELDKCNPDQPPLMFKLKKSFFAKVTTQISRKTLLNARPILLANAPKMTASKANKKAVIKSNIVGVEVPDMYRWCEELASEIEEKKSK